MKLSQFNNVKSSVEIEVVNIAGQEIITERLHELGFHIGMSFKLLGRAPFSGPYLIQHNSTILALRDNEADCLSVKLRTL